MKKNKINAGTEMFHIVETSIGVLKEFSANIFIFQSLFWYWNIPWYMTQSIWFFIIPDITYGGFNSNETIKMMFAKLFLSYFRVFLYHSYQNKNIINITLLSLKAYYLILWTRIQYTMELWKVIQVDNLMRSIENCDYI